MIKRLKHLKKSLKSWVYSFTARFKPRTFETLEIEERAVRGVPAHLREEAIVELRFKAWLKYHCITCTVLERSKMKLAFKAGFYARTLE